MGGKPRGSRLSLFSLVSLPDLAWLFLEYDPLLCFPPTHPQANYDVWILLTVVGTVFVIILASVLRIRCRPHPSRPVSSVGCPIEVGMGVNVEGDRKT